MEDKDEMEDSDEIDMKDGEEIEMEDGDVYTTSSLLRYLSQKTTSVFQ